MSTVMIVVAVLAAFATPNNGDCPTLSITVNSVKRTGKIVEVEVDVKNTARKPLWLEKAGTSGAVQLQSLEIEKKIGSNWVIIAPMRDVPSFELIQLDPGTSVKTYVTLQDPQLIPSRRAVVPLSGAFRAVLRYYCNREDWLPPGPARLRTTLERSGRLASSSVFTITPAGGPPKRGAREGPRSSPLMLVCCFPIQGVNITIGKSGKSGKIRDRRKIRGKSGTDGSISDNLLTRGAIGTSNRGRSASPRDAAWECAALHSR